jgi:hypothetical protein
VSAAQGLREIDMKHAETTPKISTGWALVYSAGRGGTKWPESRHTAKIDGRTLMRKDGIERTFKTEAAALKAARAHLTPQPS